MADPLVGNSRQTERKPFLGDHFITLRNTPLARLRGSWSPSGPCPGTLGPLASSRRRASAQARKRLSRLPCQPRGFLAESVSHKRRKLRPRRPPTPSGQHPAAGAASQSAGGFWPKKTQAMHLVQNRPEYLSLSVIAGSPDFCMHANPRAPSTAFTSTVRATPAGASLGLLPSEQSSLRKFL